MLEKSKIVHGVRVFRKGLGYYLYLLQVIQDYKLFESLKNHLVLGSVIPEISKAVIALALRIFTNIKRPYIYIIFHADKAIDLFIEILKYNAAPQVFHEDDKDKSKAYSVDAIAADILDIFAGGGYSFTPDYIFNNIDFYTFYQIKERIEKRKAKDMTIAFNVAHNSEAAIKDIEAMIGIETISSWSDPRLKQWQKK